jgi:hypothetical protein
MNDKFDDLAKSLTQSVTRRETVKKFSLGIASLALETCVWANARFVPFCERCFEHPKSIERDLL